MNYRIIENFLLLAAVPRKSHHEERVSRFLYDWALSKGLSAERDEAGNVIIEKGASAGAENAPLTILQAHMDMVTVWEDGKKFDPLTDPIAVIDDGETLRALGTSLGADDGIGVAIAMTILEDPAAVHGPLRAIFTVNEEDGMTGAESLDERHLKGKYLINLDWEQYGSLCCSSAGSDQYHFTRKPQWNPVREGVAFTVSAQHFTGGHSGTAIHCGRANAIRTVAGMIDAAIRIGVPVQLASFIGGSAHNAIPDSASATVVVPQADWPCFLSVADAEAVTRRAACAETDPDAEITVKMLDTLPKKAVSEEDTSAYINIMSTVPNGVRTMSAAIPGLVESSSNLGVAELTEDAMTFIVHPRSCEPARMDEMRELFGNAARTHGFDRRILMNAPAWPVRPGSALVELCTRHFTDISGTKMKVEPVHAGLECGSWARKNPELDIISIGPDILDIHSPRETLVLSTVYDCGELVRRILKDISEK